MEAGAKGCEVVVSGKVRGQRAKAMKFVDGMMIHSGEPCEEYIDTAVRHVQLRQGVLGIKVKIMKAHDTEGINGVKRPHPDHVTIAEPKEEEAPGEPRTETRNAVLPPQHMGGQPQPGAGVGGGVGGPPPPQTGGGMGGQQQAPVPQQQQQMGPPMGAVAPPMGPPQPMGGIPQQQQQQVQHGLPPQHMMGGGYMGAGQPGQMMGAGPPAHLSQPPQQQQMGGHMQPPPHGGYGEQPPHPGM